jgi:hypothetical protein
MGTTEIAAYVFLGTVLFVLGFGGWWMLRGEPESGEHGSRQRASMLSLAGREEFGRDQESEGFSEEERAPSATSSNRGAREVGRGRSGRISSTTEGPPDDPELSRYDKNAQSFDERVALFEQEMSAGRENPGLTQSFQESFQQLLSGLTDIPVQLSTRCSQSVCELEVKGDAPTGILLSRTIQGVMRLDGYASGDVRYDQEVPEGFAQAEHGFRLMVDAEQAQSLQQQLVQERAAAEAAPQTAPVADAQRPVSSAESQPLADPPPVEPPAQPLAPADLPQTDQAANSADADDEEADDEAAADDEEADDEAADDEEGDADDEDADEEEADDEDEE